MSEQQGQQPENKPQLFNPAAVQPTTGVSAATSRATQEIQAALVIAQANPRNETKAIAKIVMACQRRGLAELSEYEYSRGGTRITGPSIDLILAIANRWGNLLYGWEEVERANGQSKVRCWAWDLESGSRSERSFYVRHWRDTKAGGYELKDERDIYELLANQASRRVRSCLEQVIDQDVIMTALETCHTTLRKGETVPLRDRAVQMCVAFAEFGVTQSMIEKRLGNKLDAISENQLASLRRVYKGLKDGVGQREDYFTPDPLEPKMPSDASEEKAEAEAGLAPSTPPTQPSATPPAKPPGKRTAKAAAEPNPENPLAVVRRLCSGNGIKEGELLGHLSENGSTDGSVATLEELMMTAPGVIKSVIDNWAEVRAQIQGE